MGVLRSLAFGLLLAVFFAMALAANVGYWGLNSVLDADAFVAGANSAMGTSAVRSYLGDQIAGQIVTLLETQLGSIPPVVMDQLDLPANATKTQVQGALSQLTQHLLADPRLQAVIDDALRTLHDSITSAAEGTGALAVQGNQVVLNLDQMVASIEQQVDPGQPGLFGVPVPGNLGQVALFRANGLDLAARWLGFARGLEWVLPAIAAVCALLALVVARRRIAALAWIGMCLMIVGLGCYGIVAVGGPIGASALAPGSAQSAIASALSAFAGSLAQQSAIVAAVGIVLVLVGAIFGRGGAGAREMTFA